MGSLSSFLPLPLSHTHEQMQQLLLVACSCPDIHMVLSLALNAADVCAAISRRRRMVTFDLHCVPFQVFASPSGRFSF